MMAAESSRHSGLLGPIPQVATDIGENGAGRAAADLGRDVPGLGQTGDAWFARGGAFVLGTGGARLARRWGGPGGQCGRLADGVAEQLGLERGGAKQAAGDARDNFSDVDGAEVARDVGEVSRGGALLRRGGQMPAVGDERAETRVRRHPVGWAASSAPAAGRSWWGSGRLVGPAAADGADTDRTRPYLEGGVYYYPSYLALRTPNLGLERQIARIILYTALQIWSCSVRVRPSAAAAQPTAPIPTRIGGPPTPSPSRTGRLLTLVRTLIAYGRHLAAARNNAPPATDLADITRHFGTIDIGEIVARITRGLLRAAALEPKLFGRPIREPATLAARPPHLLASRAPPPRGRKHRRGRTTHRPSAQARGHRGRDPPPPAGAVLADICRDLGIGPSNPL